MSLNFSDDEETYETKITEEENKYQGYEENENNFDTELKEGEEGGEAEAEEVVPKKKKKSSVGFHLKNIFNEVALNRIHRYMKKKRKSDCLKRGEEFYDEDNSEDSDEENKEGNDVDDLEKYAREEQKRLAQMIPEKDEFWELYIYLNLKKKKKKN